MNRPCDLCEQGIEPGQPRFGARGAGDKSGPRIGFDRHYSCHTDRFGRPEPISEIALHSEMRAASPALIARRKVKVPVVTKGRDYNRSTNAGRAFAVLRRISEKGRTRVEIECPFCFAVFWAFVWSIRGGGKCCPNCRAKHASFGEAFPLVGNEDL